MPRDSLTRIAVDGVEKFGPVAFLLDEIRRQQILVASHGEKVPDPWPGSPLAITPAEKAALAEAEAEKNRRRWNESTERERARQEQLAAQEEEATP